MIVGKFFFVCIFTWSTSLTEIHAQELKCDSINPQCCDRNRFCTFWAQQGECNRNPNWMLSNCQISCNNCIRPGGGDLALLPQTPTPVAPIRFTAPTTALPTLMSQIPSRDTSVSNNGCPAVQPMEMFFAPTMSNGQFAGGVSRSGCGAKNTVRDCTRNMCFHRQFRSMDGVCNNFGSPLLGASFMPNSRFLPSAYDDGVNALVGSRTRNRPNPRQVSISLLSSQQSIPLNTSSLMAQWGQFIAHDMTQNALGGGCNCGSSSPHCVNIPGIPNDHLRLQCSSFSRSIAECGTGFQGRPREQMNLNTAFIDGSAVYGSDSSAVRQLRSGAMLRFVGDFRRQMIPANQNTVFGGDTRAGIFAGLHSLQTYFLRMHNSIANQLGRINPRWGQDRVFEETRKIVGGIIQVITYQEFLPAFLGPSLSIGSYPGYNAQTNPTIMNEFAGAAFRMHGMLENRYSLIDGSFRPISSMTFGQGVSSSAPNLVASSMDFIIRGLIGTSAKSPQRLAQSVADSIFNLATVSIQRGRDHGFQPYNAYRRRCGLVSLTSFDNWPEVTDPNVIARLKQLYPGGVDTLDLYVGGLLERPQPGSSIGPTFACIDNEQFKRLRDGDRFFYENPGVFTNDQLIALRRVTISWVICSHSESISRISPTGFFTDNGAAAIGCSSLQPLDLNAWREQ